ncbi:protein NLRC3-like isoform X2 [Anguilla rostrata]|uniref:protein NLRC3-like isoform X2 n=1 Tax=Anguilla rostrata TaxID=7938 RepID=UPI0030D52DA8
MSSSEKKETDDETHSPARKSVRVERAGSPVPSCLSMKSDYSMGPPLNFRGQSTGRKRVRVERTGSPVPSCLSMKSDYSMGPPLNFRGEFTDDQSVTHRWGAPEERLLSEQEVHQSLQAQLMGEDAQKGLSLVQVERTGSPFPSCLSMKSDYSMGPPLNFRGEFTADQSVTHRWGAPEERLLSEQEVHQSLQAQLMGEDAQKGLSLVQVERTGSPFPSCLSMKSDYSMGPPLNFRGEFTADQRVQVERTGSPFPSCLSMKSNYSMGPPLNFRGEFTADQRFHYSLESNRFKEKSSEERSFLNQSLLHTLMRLKKIGKLKDFQSHLSQDCPECFNCLPEDPFVLDKFMKIKELFKSHQIADYPECTEREQEDPEPLYIVEKMLETCGSERSLKITLHILRNMKQNNFSDSLERNKQHNESIKRAQQALKTALKKRFECVFEALAKQNHRTLLNEIYTELYITEGGSGGVNNEHEVRQIETASKRQTTEETAILCNDIFKPLPGQEKPIRTVLTKGIAGIGKTVSVQKFILDWAEGEANQDIDFIFTLPFRDLNLKKEREFSLMQLLHHYFPQLKEIKSVEGDGVKVVFIFDGLDECRLPLDFQSNKLCCDITESSSVDALLTNLIKGNLLPSALLWITSRPAAAKQIPPECVQQVTEVRGFNDPQKEEYFRKKIRDQNQASRIISHIKSSRSLYIMCHIPVFCWISATVLETMLGETESGVLPKTLTEMYTHFLLIQTNVKNQKYHGANEMNPKKVSESDTEIILKLGRLAFLQLEKGNLIFYEQDLRESGIDISEASVYSGVCTEIFKEECGLDQEKVYCFVHLSIQEYLAALYVFHSCVNENRNVLGAEESEPHSDRVQLSELHRSAVDQALESKNGHLDLFLRFLLGLSLDSIQNLLGGILTQTGSRSPVPDPQPGSRQPVPDQQTGSRSPVPDPQTGSRQPVPDPQTGSRQPVPDPQTGSRSPVPDPQTQTESRSKSIETTVQYIKMMIKQESSADRTINLFHCLNELNDNSLVQEIQNSLSSGKLSHKKLEPDQCSALAFVLLMSEEVLDEFDLNIYNTSAAGYLRLVPVVRNCRKAILNSCDLTEKSCDIVASALQSSNSPLRDLDLSNNYLGDSGVELLCAGLMSPNCKLQRLGLNSCELTEKSCEFVASALQSSNSPLRDLDLSCNYLGDSGVKLLCAGLRSPKCELQRLDLSYNNLGDSGVELLCAALMSPNCKIGRLGLNSCDLTEKSCTIVASALQSSNSPLRDLDLSNNNLGDSEVKLLCAGLRSPNCKLQRLGLGWCNLTEGCCDVLASVLRSPHSELRDLELRDNELQDSGVRALSAGVEDPHCKLQRLGLSGCELTEEALEIVASALQSSNSPLRDLDLSNNYLGYSGVELLCAALMSPKCKLQSLGLNSCELTEKSCEFVASALQSSNSPLTDLDLSNSNLGDSGVELLCAGLMSPDCKLQRLDLSCNNLGDAGVKLLCAGLMSPNCKIGRLGLGWCNLTEGCCDVLALVLRCPHSELRDLELRDNELQDSGVRALSAGLEDPHCKLQRLGLSGCRVTQRGCDSLASALSSNPSHLRELDLRYNHPGDSGVRALSAAKLDSLTLLVDHGGEKRTKPGPRKYGCQLTLDPNTAHRNLYLSEGNRKVTHTWIEEPYPAHPERFEHRPQVVCRESVCESCYWEAEWSVSERGWVCIAVTYEGISRKGGESHCAFGWNKNSWSLECDKHSYSVRHNEKQTDLPAPPSPYRRAGVCDDDDDGGDGEGVCVYRVGVCVDRSASTLSFYSVSDSDTLTLLHRFCTHFTQHTPLCAGFYVYDSSSVSLWQLE